MGKGRLGTKMEKLQNWFGRMEKQRENCKTLILVARSKLKFLSSYLKEKP